LAVAVVSANAPALLGDKAVFDNDSDGDGDENENAEAKAEAVDDADDEADDADNDRPSSISICKRRRCSAISQTAGAADSNARRARRSMVTRRNWCQHADASFDDDTDEEIDDDEEEDVGDAGKDVENENGASGANGLQRRSHAHTLRSAADRRAPSVRSATGRAPITTPATLECE
jgi:hypothetical protein